MQSFYYYEKRNNKEKKIETKQTTEIVEVSTVIYNEKYLQCTYK